MTSTLADRFTDAWAPARRPFLGRGPLLPLN